MRRLLVLAALLLAAGSAAAQAPTPHTVAVVRTTPERVIVRLLSLTRDGDGRVYLSAPGGLVRWRPGDADASPVRNRGGTPLGGGKLSWMGDTLAVQGWGQWTLLTTDGAPAGCRAFRTAGSEFSTQVFAERPVAGGLTVGWLLPGSAGRGIPDYLVVSRGQAVERRLFQSPPRPELITIPFPWGGGSWGRGFPAEARPLWSVADDGRGVVIVDQAPAEQPGPQRVRVMRLGTAGDTALDVTLSLPALPVSAAWRERYVAGQVNAVIADMTPGRDSAEIFRAFRDALPFPPFHPAVTAAMAGADGSAWLRLSTEDDTATWLHLDAAGRERERVGLPASLVALYADAGGLWGALPVGGGEIRIVQVTAGTPIARPPLSLTAREADIDRLARGCETE